jgi:hypothetical protein
MMGGQLVKRTAWIVLAAFAVVLALWVNPWFALVIVPALLGAALDPWRGARRAARSDRPSAKGKLGRRARWLGVGLAIAALFAVLTVGLGTLALRPGQTPPLQRPFPVPPAIGLPVTYVGSFSCNGSCTTWTAGHTLTVALSTNETPPVAELRAGMAELRWHLTRRTAVGDEIRLRFDLSEPSHSTPVRWWPIRTTRTLQLPKPIGATDPVVTLPAGPEAAELAGSLDAQQALEEGLDIYLDLEPSSALTLTYPRLAVAATTPASDLHDVAGGRQERVLAAAKATDATVSLDLLSPLGRSDGAAKLAALGTSGWGWLLVTALSGLLITPVRTAAAAFAQSLVDRIFRRQPATRATTRTRRDTEVAARDDAPTDRPAPEAPPRRKSKQPDKARRGNQSPG